MKIRQGRYALKSIACKKKAENCFRVVSIEMLERSRRFHELKLV